MPTSRSDSGRDIAGGGITSKNQSHSRNTRNSQYVSTVGGGAGMEGSIQLPDLQPEGNSRLSATAVTLGLPSGDVVAAPSADNAPVDPSLAAEGGSQANSVESLGDGIPPPTVGKPQVIVRIRPSPNIDTTPMFEIDPQTKTIQIRVDRDRKKTQTMATTSNPKPPSGFIYFPADNVLENSSQDDTFSAVALEVVEKAMLGIPGMIVAIGPQDSGKSFSLFGLSGRYRNRGIVARAFEKMFEIKELRQSETHYKFGIGIIEVRRERIRDLLTLSPNEINDVGDRGPRGMYIEEVDCMEHGLGLLLRALIGQKLIHQEPYERYHTIVYVEIVGVSPLAAELVQFQSRITFAKIASAPFRTDDLRGNLGSNARVPSSLFYGPSNSFTPCTIPPQGKSEMKFKSKQAVFPNRKCCNPGYTTGPLAEGIAVRRDVFALEQIFLKANEMYRIHKYFAKLENLGLSMIASEKRRLASGHNFRQNRLAHCLKDILDTKTEIRILLHIRPDKAHLKSSLEAMRFAERARLVPSNLDDDPKKGKADRTEDQILQEVIADIAPELMHPTANMELLNTEKMKVIQEQAVKYFENNIDGMKVVSKEKVKVMFENFRVLWNFLWELELNVTLRKAEDEMTMAMEKLTGNGSHTGTTLEPLGASGVSRKGSHGKRGSDGKGTGLEGDEDDGKDAATLKKMTKRMKKEKDRKRKKDKHNQHHHSTNDLKKRGSEDGKLHQDSSSKRASGEENAHNQHGEGEHLATEGRRASQLAPDSRGEDDKNSVSKGETEVNRISPPEEDNGSIPSKEQTPAGDPAPLNDNPDASSLTVESAAPAPSGETSKSVTIQDNKTNPEGSPGDDASPGKRILSQDEGQAFPSLPPQTYPQQTIASTTHIHHAAGLRHNSAFFVRGGFADVKLHNIWGHHHHHHHGGSRKTLTDEELLQLAAQQEHAISNNFEEMKKIARRQAIHLLRTGVRRPQWMSLF